MNLLTKVERWGDAHHPKWIDIFRVILGLILIWKGVQFAQNLHEFTRLMGSSFFAASIGISILAHYIIVVHIIGGVLITLGTETRTACLLLLPIVIGALLFIDYSGSIFKPYANLNIAILILVLTVLFGIEGNGPVSVENMGDTENGRE